MNVELMIDTLVTVVENSISVDRKSGHYLNALLLSYGGVHLGN